MNPTRRALCGLGIASVPLAVLGRPVFSAGQEPAGAGDSFLSYLVEDTKRNCRLAAKPGRERAKHLRRLGSNGEVLAAYLLSQERAARIKEVVSRRVSEEGVDALAFRVRESWPGLASSLAADYGVAVPASIEHDALTTAIGHLQRYGCPRMTGVRRWFERQAAHIEQWEGRAGVPLAVRQTPGSDFGPPGWAAGLGDPGNQISCGDMAVLVAAIGVVAELMPELAPVLGPISAILTLILTMTCID